MQRRYWPQDFLLPSFIFVYQPCVCEYGIECCSSLCRRTWLSTLAALAVLKSGNPTSNAIQSSKSAIQYLILENLYTDISYLYRRNEIIFFGRSLNFMTSYNYLLIKQRDIYSIVKICSFSIQFKGYLETSLLCVYKDS